MERKIKIYSVILAVVYFAMIIYGLCSGMESFKAGFDMGMNSSKDKKLLEIHHFKVKPQNGAYTHPEKVLNLKSGDFIQMEAREYTALISVPPGSHSMMSFIIRIVQMFCSFIFLFILLFIPVLFFKMIRSVVKGDILNNKNIKRITIIGWLLLIYYVMNVFLYNIGEAYITKQVLELENYKIVCDFSDMTVLILSIVALLFAEILKFSQRLKEEQELTI